MCFPYGSGGTQNLFSIAFSIQYIISYSHNNFQQVSWTYSPYPIVILFLDLHLCKSSLQACNYNFITYYNDFYFKYVLLNIYLYCI